MDHTKASSDKTSKTTAAAPIHGESAGELIYDTVAGARFSEAGVGGGAWIYPASYDDHLLARRRAHGLTRGLGIPFHVDLFGVETEEGARGISVAVKIPGYYAYTLADPRPHLIVLDSAGYWQSPHRISSSVSSSVGVKPTAETEE